MAHQNSFYPVPDKYCDNCHRFYAKQGLKLDTKDKWEYWCDKCYKNLLDKEKTEAELKRKHEKRVKKMMEGGNQLQLNDFYIQES